MLIDGEIKPIVRHTTFFGECRSAILATSETPKHAKSSIHKVLAYQKVLIRKNNASKTPCQADRRATFLTLGKDLYRTYYLN